MKRWLSIALLLWAAAVQAAQVGLIKIDGAIGPATANYISRSIDTAASQNDECLVIQLNTPGGLANSMNDIVQDFYAAKIPVVVIEGELWNAVSETPVEEGKNVEVIGVEGLTLKVKPKL